jgi:hypothetical protein
MSPFSSYLPLVSCHVGRVLKKFPRLCTCFQCFDKIYQVLLYFYFMQSLVNILEFNVSIIKLVDINWEKW